MRRSPTPLIARLRRRLVTSVWLFALLALAKSSFATGCLTDGLVPVEKASATVSARATDVAMTAVMSATADDGSTQADCLDSGLGNCHCACAHASPMALTHAGWSVSAAALYHDVWRSQRNDTAPRSTTLRPPITC
jgi:hypothetical protein